MTGARGGIEGCWRQASLGWLSGFALAVLFIAGCTPDDPDGGSGTTTTTLAGDPPVAAVAPTISGEAVVSEPLTLSLGTWTGTQPIAVISLLESCTPTLDDCAPVAPSNVVEYIPAVADIGRVIRATVTATNAIGSSTANAVSEIIATADGEIVSRHCGALTRNEVWDRAHVHIVDCSITVPAAVTLTIETGAVVRTRCGPPSGGAGLELTVEGGLNAGARAVLTDWTDDTVAPATAVSASTTCDGPWRLTGSGSSVVALDRTVVRTADLRGQDSSSSWTITGSTLTATNLTMLAGTTLVMDDTLVHAGTGPARLVAASGARGVGSPAGSVHVEITGSTFDHAALQLAYIDDASTIADNTFRNHDDPITLTQASAATLDLSGAASGNRFAGLNRQALVSISDARIPAGATSVWRPDDATVYLSGGFAVSGDLTVGQGAVVKHSCHYSSSVSITGNYRATSATLTSITDDTVGGPHNFGPGGVGCPDGPWRLTGSGSSVVALDRTVVRTADLRGQDSSSSWTITGSTLTATNLTMLAGTTLVMDDTLVHAGTGPARLVAASGARGVGSPAGSVHVEITGSTFDHAALQLAYIDDASTIADNTFRNHDDPITLTQASAATLDLSGAASGNRFAGLNRQALVSISDARIPAGATSVWRPDDATVYLSGGFAVSGDLTVGQGAVVKHSCHYSSSVSITGNYRATSATLTSITDDTVGGPHNFGPGGVGCPDGPWRLTGSGSSVVALDRTVVRTADLRGQDSSSSWTITGSTLTATNLTMLAGTTLVMDDTLVHAGTGPARLVAASGARGVGSPAGSVHVEITGSTFDHAALQLAYIDDASTIADNTFRNHDDPITLTQASAATLDLSGAASGNRFAGLNRQALVSISDARIPAGATSVWRPDDATVYLSGGFAVSGDLTVGQGAVVKHSCHYSSSVSITGNYRATSATLTSITDDTVGGPHNFGPGGVGCPDGPWRLTGSGSSVVALDRTVVRTADLRGQDSSSSWTITGSTLTATNLTMLAGTTLVMDDTLTHAGTGPARLVAASGARGVGSPAGSVHVEITGSTFDHAALQLAYIDDASTIADNTFRNHDDPITLTQASAATLDLSGSSSANRLEDQGRRRTVVMNSARVPPGAVFQCRGSTTTVHLVTDGLTVLPGGGMTVARGCVADLETPASVAGTLNLTAGSTLRLRSLALVYVSGVANLNGAPADPVVVTSTLDSTRLGGVSTALPNSISAGFMVNPTAAFQATRTWFGFIAAPVHLQMVDIAGTRTGPASLSNVEFVGTTERVIYHPRWLLPCGQYILPPMIVSATPNHPRLYTEECRLPNGQVVPVAGEPVLYLLSAPVGYTPNLSPL